MTAQIYHLRDYKTRQEREMEIERIGLAIIADALAPDGSFARDPSWPEGGIFSRGFDDLPKWPDHDSGDCA